MFAFIVLINNPPLSQESLWATPGSSLGTAPQISNVKGFSISAFFGGLITVRQDKELLLQKLGNSRSKKIHILGVSCKIVLLLLETSFLFRSANF